MALRDAILASLLEGEASGYDMAKAFDSSVANFWAATPQQLYRELDGLEEQGLVAARVVQQERRPNKRLFRLTRAGRKELREFTSRTARPTAIRDDLLVKVQAVDAGDTAGVIEAVEERLAGAHAKLGRYEKLRAHLLYGRSEKRFLADASRVGPYLTLMRGIAFETENVRWCDQVIEVLRAREG